MNASDLHQNIHRTAIVLFFIFLLVTMWAVSRCVYLSETKSFHWMAPEATDGDEPHYLMMINSILFDKDLQLQEDYWRVERGGWDAGIHNRSRQLDHHTYLVDRVTGESEFWGNVFDRHAPIPRDSMLSMGFKRKKDRFSDLSQTIERSSHPIGSPAVIAGLVAWTHPDKTQTESRVSWAILCVSWLALIGIYRMAREEGLGLEEGFMVVGLLLFSTPWLAYSRFYFSEPLIGFALVLGLWGMRSDRMIMAALAVVLAAAVKPPFALVGVSWIIERLLARQFRSAFILTLVMGLGGAALVAFNEWQAHIPLIAGNSDNSESWTFPNLNTLFHYRYGLFIFVPWAFVVFILMARSLFQFSQNPPNILIRQIALPCFCFLILLSIRKFGGYWSYGPRYWVPFLPWLALIFGMALTRFGVVMRRCAYGLIWIGILIGFSGALFYTLTWGKQPFYAFTLLTP